MNGFARALTAAAAAIGILAAASPAYAPIGSAARGTLLARAVLPADTLASGPQSGAALGTGPFNGVTPPFPHQPVQGFSGILRAAAGEWWAMPDNGYGRKENSADFLLRIYRLRVAFKRGHVAVESFIQLRDPHHKFPYALVRTDRLLTGADVDPESIFAGRRRTFWIGDEFGPWMLHFDRSGRLLERPIPLHGVKSPQNPTLTPGEEPTLGRSKGFEASAPAADGRHAYVFLEGALLADHDQRRRYIYELDLRKHRFTGRRWAYRAEEPSGLVADAKLVGGKRLLVIERDDLEGAQARLKKVYEIDLSRPDADGFVSKREVVDLLDLRDAHGHSFSFPLRSVESVFLLPGGRLVVANDNNYPFDAGRHPGHPDGNEWIMVRPAVQP
jgi:hypothetical protein